MIIVHLCTVQWCTLHNLYYYDSTTVRVWSYRREFAQIHEFGEFGKGPNSWILQIHSRGSYRKIHESVQINEFAVQIHESANSCMTPFFQNHEFKNYLFIKKKKKLSQHILSDSIRSDPPIQMIRSHHTVGTVESITHIELRWSKVSI